MVGSNISGAAFAAPRLSPLVRLGLVGRRLFEPLRQFQVFRGDFAHLLLGIRVLEGLGFGQEFFGAVSRVPREQQKLLVRHCTLPIGP
jgi:hypothetical protein